MTLISETVLPEPDSPTTPTISRSPTRKETLSTARRRPRSVRKETERPFTSSSVLLAASGKTHPRVEGGVDNVDHRIGRHDEERSVDDGCHDDRKIEVLQRVIGELADPLQAEDDFGQQGTAAHQGTEIEPEQSDEGDQ